MGYIANGFAYINKQPRGVYSEWFATLIAAERKSVPDILGAKAFLSVLDIRGLVPRSVWQLRANILRRTYYMRWPKPLPLTAMMLKYKGRQGATFAGKIGEASEYF